MRTSICYLAGPGSHMREPGDGTTRTTQAQPESAGSTSSALLKVLVVVDGDGTRKNLQKAVVALGHECRVASDGREAWQLHRGDHADVILSDWKMPNMDGLELCRRVRADDEGSAYTYFILMAGEGDRDHFLQGMRAGADDYHAKPVGLEELQARLASAARAIAVYRKLEEQNSALRRDSQRSFRLARVDALTGVANRLSMDEDLATLWARTKRYGRPVCGALCDIDEFKSYNDAHGHVAGDEVLVRVAQTIRSKVRESDLIYRYGGEEFLLILPEQTLAEATRATERVRQAIERLAIAAASKGVVTISIGLGAPQASDATIQDWLRRTDAALYAAKAKGRNRVELAAAS
jgi:two-component system chemotaxis response regulator CheY